MNQKTIRKPVKLQGIGLHSGKKVNLKFLPAPTNYGVVFRRVDLGIPIEIPARFSFGKQTTLCTTIQKESIEVKTIEHVMAAINGLGIDNLVVEIDNEEVPIMDGSASIFYKVLRRKGFKEQKAIKKFIKILKPIEVTLEDKSASLFPSSSSSFSFYIDFNHGAIGKQSYYTNLSPNKFFKDISAARTFGFEEHVIQLKKSGMILGGSLENAILLGENGKVLNKKGLRYSDEFVRHKVLDSIGDLALSGERIIGHYHGAKAGHGINLLLLQKLFSSPDCWEYVEQESEVMEQRRSVA